MNSLKKENLIAGFRGCGIYPLNRQVVLNRVKVTDETLQNTAMKHLGPSFISVLEKHVGIGVEKNTENTHKRGRKIRPGSVVAIEDISDQHVPTQSKEPHNPFADILPGPTEGALEYHIRRTSTGQWSIEPRHPFAYIQSYGKDGSDCSDDEDETQVVPENPLKRYFGDEEEDELEALVFPGKPTARSYRNLGLAKPKKQLLSTRPKQKKRKVKSWVCASCDVEQKSRKEDHRRWIECDLCADKFHLECSEILYEEDQYWSMDLDGYPFECGTCLELSARV